MILVVPVLFGNVLGDWGKHVAEFLPSQAGGAFITIIPDGLSLQPVGRARRHGAVGRRVRRVALAVLRRRDA